jgi:C4-dicarboxylate transporter, DctM subunit
LLFQVAIQRQEQLMNTAQQDREETRDEKKVIDPMANNVVTQYLDTLSDIGGTVAGWGMLFVSVIMVYEIIMRYLGLPTTWVVEISGYAMVGCTFLSAAYVLRLNGHIQVDFVTHGLSQATKNVLDVLNYLFILGYTLLILFYSGMSFFDAIAMNERSASLLRLHIGWLYGVIVIGCILLALQALLYLVKAIRRVSHARLEQDFMPSLLTISGYLVLMAIGGWLYIQYPMVGLIAIMIILLFGGIPIFAALGLIGCFGLYILMGTDTGLSQIGPICIKALDNFTLLAVPLYIMGGQILVSSGVGKELFEVCSKWIGHWPGGSMLATVGACAIFAAISGSSVATAATIGIIAIPEMLKSGYRPSHAFGVVAAGGTLGILIPPSGTMIIYSMLTDESTGALFVGGIIPGIIMAFLFGIFAFILCVTTGCYERVPKASWSERLASIQNSFWGLLAPFIVIFGIYSGLLTPTEAAAVVLVYALIVGLIRRKIKISDLNGVLCTGTKSSTMLLMIVVGAIILGTVGTYLQIPQMASQFIGGLPYPPWAIMALLCIFYIVLGCFLEVVSIMLITIPIVYPIIIKLGFNGLWFGVFIVLLMEMALITPPVGMNLFVIQGIAKTEIAPVVKGAFPYMIILVIGLFILYLWPDLILWLPGTMGYARH